MGADVSVGGAEAPAIASTPLSQSAGLHHPGHWRRQQRLGEGGRRGEGRGAGPAQRRWQGMGSPASFSSYRRTLIPPPCHSLAAAAGHRHLLRGRHHAGLQHRCGGFGRAGGHCCRRLRPGEALGVYRSPCAERSYQLCAWQTAASALPGELDPLGTARHIEDSVAASSCYQRMHQKGAPLSRAHCASASCPLFAAHVTVRPSHGHGGSCARSHCSDTSCPNKAAYAHAEAHHGHGGS